MWQFIAGGAEDSESPLEAAKREAFEEAAVCSEYSLVQLDSIGSIPRKAFDNTNHWPKSLNTVPEYSFAVDVGDLKIQLSQEHDEFKWLCYYEALDLLSWETNRLALCELNEILTEGCECKEKNA